MAEEIVVGEVISNGTYTTTDPQCDVDIRMGDGAAARAPVTVGDALRRTAQAVPEKVALRARCDCFACAAVSPTQLHNGTPSPRSTTAGAFRGRRRRSKRAAVPTAA